MAKMELDELKGILEAEKQDALGSQESDKLSKERSRNLEYYLGTMTDMPGEPDRSQAVSTDVADTVEGLMPAMMEIFTSGDHPVEFTPVGPEDEELAQQETDVVAHTVMQENPGFIILHTMIKDALTVKTGTVKVRWDKTEEEERDSFYGLTDDEYALLQTLPGVEIVEHSEQEPGEESDVGGGYG